MHQQLSAFRMQFKCFSVAAAHQTKLIVYALATGTKEFRSFLLLPPRWVDVFCIQISKLFICISFDSVHNCVYLSLSRPDSGFWFYQRWLLRCAHTHTHAGVRRLCIVSTECYFYCLLFCTRMRKLWETKRRAITNGNATCETLDVLVKLIKKYNLLFCENGELSLARYTWTNSMILVGKKRHENSIRKERPANWKAKNERDGRAEKIDSGDNDGEKVSTVTRFYFAFRSFSLSPFLLLSLSSRSLCIQPIWVCVKRLGAARAQRSITPHCVHLVLK